MLVLCGTRTLFHLKMYKGTCFQTEAFASVDSLLIFHWRLQKKTNTMYMVSKGEVKRVEGLSVTKIT